MDFFAQMTKQLIVSWPDRSSPKLVINDIQSCYGYETNHEARLSSLPVKMTHTDDVITKLWRHRWIISLVSVLKITSFRSECIVSRYLSYSNFFQTQISNLWRHFLTRFFCTHRCSNTWRIICNWFLGWAKMSRYFKSRFSRIFEENSTFVTWQRVKIFSTRFSERTVKTT